MFTNTGRLAARLSAVRGYLKGMTMNRIWIRLACSLAAIAFGVVGGARAHSQDTPMTRLRPIGAPSAVDAYRPPQASLSAYRETAYQNNLDASMPNAFANQNVRQAVMLQQFEAPALPGGSLPMNNFVLPQADPTPNGPVAGPATSSTPLPPRALPNDPGSYQPVPINRSGISSSSDFAPLTQPQLGGEFATIGNCNCISGPSSYSAASGLGCGSPINYNTSQAYVPPPAQIAAPAVLPGGFIAPASNGVPRGPLISFGQDLNPVQVGQGIVGQPVAYVPGQRIRNWIRYIFP